MLCRVAENLFWLSRYLERAIAVVRLVDVMGHLELDAGELDGGAVPFWAPLLEPGRPGAFASAALGAAGTPDEIRHHLVFDPEHRNSVVSCIRQSRAAAREVRDSISSEMWERLNSLYLSLLDSHLVRLTDEDSHTFFRKVLMDAMLVQGLAADTLAHDEPWQFVTLGRYLERADNTARLLGLESHLLAAGDDLSGDIMVRWLAVLRSCGSAEAYARYYSLRVEPARIVEFLLLNPVFPQSVRFAIAAAERALASIARAEGTESGAPSRALGQLHARLEHVAVDEVFEEGLERYLLDVRYRVARVSDLVSREHFRNDPEPVRQAAATRAAEIMAAQQQQQQQQ